MTYYRIYTETIDGCCLVGAEVYWTKDAAEDAARVRTALTGREWKVRERALRCTRW